NAGYTRAGQQNAGASASAGTDRPHFIGANEINCRWDTARNEDRGFLLSCCQYSAWRRDDRTNKSPRYLQSAARRISGDRRSKSPAQVAAFHAVASYKAGPSSLRKE